MQEAVHCLAIELMLDLVKQWIHARHVLFLWIILNSSNNSKKKWESKPTTKIGRHNNDLSRKSMTRRTVKSIERIQCIIRSREIFAWVFPINRRVMRSEFHRLLTFSLFPLDPSVSAIKLAANGFFYTEVDAVVECFECGRTHRNWDTDGVYFPTEDIQNTHTHDCPFRTGQQSARNVPMHDQDENILNDIVQPTANGQHSARNASMHDQDENTLNNIIQPTAIEELEARFPGIDTSQPKHMEYAIFVSRLTSFKNWPSGHVVSPNALARAGLFYTGFKDRVRCFYCGLGLVSWEIGDDPWIEHARHSPECTYVQRNKPPTSNGTERQMSAGDNEVTAPGIPSQSNVSLEAKQTDALDDNNRCRICLDNRNIIVFLPCGHLVSCAECAPALRLCPICRADIRGTVRALLP